MTVGELARFFRASSPILAPLDLKVVAMRGWERRMLWDDTGLTWRPPSPNLRTPRAALAYPALGLIEGVEISEGRGIEETFEKIGAPWIDEAAYAAALNALGLPGVQFLPTTFTPRAMPASPDQDSGRLSVPSRSTSELRPVRPSRGHRDPGPLFDHFAG
jgi:uncharacterized protein YbbC (DUF1343 family)